MNNGYTETITARVKPRTKALINKHNVSPRLVFEKGLQAIFADDVLKDLERESLKDRIRAAKAEVVVLEQELEDLESNVNSQGLHSDGGTV